MEIGFSLIFFQIFSIILLLFGSLVTYQQTVNYSLPSMVANLLNIEVMYQYRFCIKPFFRFNLFKFKHSRLNGKFVLLLIALFITLPISLIKKIDQLNQFSTFSICFYFVFSFYVS